MSGRTRELKFSSVQDALVETVAFILKCLSAGGVPMSRGTWAEDGYIGRTWICYGKADEIRSVRIFAPSSNPLWRELNRLLDMETGDWRIVLKIAYPLLPRVAEKYPELAPLVEKILATGEVEVVKPAPAVRKKRRAVAVIA